MKQAARTMRGVSFVLILALLGAAAGCTVQPTSTPGVVTNTPGPLPATQTPTPNTLPPTLTPTRLPDPVVQPTPTAVPTPSVEMQFRQALIQASRNYLADTSEAADLVAQRIGYNGGKSESASLMCGPLTIAILRDAHLLPASTSLHESWLLCAREDRDDCQGITTLERLYFPPQEYTYTRVHQNIRDYDFNANPLEPGDWLYLFVSNNGFDHMTLVTRVDENGAAYTVTNLDRGSGFKIVETLLYDPAQPGQGLIYELTDPARKQLGMSGNGGFLLVRRKTSLPAWSMQPGLLTSLNDAAHWNIWIQDVNTGQVLFESLPNERFHPASMIKVPVAMLVMSILESQGKGPADLPSISFGRYTLEQLLRSMLVQSEEEATDSLIDYIYTYTSERTVFKSWGINDTSFEPRRTTAYDLAAFLSGLYRAEFLSDESSRYILSLMNVQTENDASYLGVIPAMLPNTTLYNKRGTLVSPQVIVSDMGILTSAEHTLLIIVSGRPAPSSEITYEEIQASLENFAAEVARAISGLP